MNRWSLWRSSDVARAILISVLMWSCADSSIVAPLSRKADFLTTTTPGVHDVLPTDPAHVSAGHYHSCALRVDGKVGCWGNNSEGQAPTMKAAESGRYTQLSGGQYHTCALRSDGVVECWGLPDAMTPAIQTATTGTFIQVSAAQQN